MIKDRLIFVLAIGALIGVSMVLAVGQAQATLLDPINGPYPDGWNYTIEFDDGALKKVEGITLEELTDFFTFTVKDPYTIDVSWNLTAFDNESLFAITVKAGNDKAGNNDIWYYTVDLDQRVVGSGQIESPNSHGISDIRLSVPDASTILLLGTSFIFLALLGRRKSKN